MSELLANAWDVGEQHQSTVHPTQCYPHHDCNPYTDAELRRAWANGNQHEENYLMTWGQFDPSGYRDNPYRVSAVPDSRTEES